MLTSSTTNSCATNLPTKPILSHCKVRFFETSSEVKSQPLSILSAA